MKDRTQLGSFSVVVALLGVLWSSLFSCGGAPSRVFSETREPMGTIVTISVVEEDERRARLSIAGAFAAIDEVERRLSTYDPESEISRLNRDGSILAGEALLEVTRRALEVFEQSEGAFDPTVQPLVELYTTSFAERGAPPSPDEVTAALALVDAGAVTIEGARITLPAGMKLTLDGIAKGYAIDRAIESLRESGVRGALVDAGGDVRVLGTKDGEPWRVALQNPRDVGDYLLVLDLEDHAVATSGDYRRYFDADREYHHIVDPRTGTSAHGVISASVLADTATTADALATAVFVLGVEAGLALIESLEGVEAFLVTEERETRQSSGW